jgi:ABC-2 type transport system permease protein
MMTIMWKELRELWLARGSGRARALSYLPILLVFGVLLPLQQRELWTEGPMAGIFATILPTILAGGVVADSFAGERERHTLETLLATRLSDRDIFLGKVIACVVYCLAFAWASALVSLITLNLTRGNRPTFFFSPSSLLLAIVAGVLLTVMTAAVGVFVSLRAPNVRTAAQLFSLATIVIFVGGPLLLRFLPAAILSWIVRVLESSNTWLLGASGAGAVLGIDLLLLALGVARFRRKQLILE